MSPHQDALDHLRVIRSLMERAHIYRAISAPAAGLGGLLSVGWASVEGWRMYKGGGVAAEQGGSFLIPWLLILAITGAINVGLLASEAKKRNQPLVSDGMRTALKAIFPPMAVGGVIGIGLIHYLHSHVLAVLIWSVCYGLALLATASFSPKSLVRLGWVFVILGTLLFWLWASNGDVRNLPSDESLAALIMGGTFGLCHLGYAFCVFFSQTTEAKATQG